MRAFVVPVVIALALAGVFGDVHPTSALQPSPGGKVLIRNSQGKVVGERTALGIVRHITLPRVGAPPRAPRGAVDPDVEPGFPVQAWHAGGTYRGGPGIHTLVGNIDGDRQSEIIATGLAAGPVYAWNHDGSLAPGWPVAETGAGYPAIADHLPQILLPPERQLPAYVAVGYMGDLLSIYAGNGAPRPGWPITTGNYVASPPALINVAGQLPAEIFIGESDSALHAYRVDATPLPGWPVFRPSGQERATPAAADLDGDGDLEIVTASGDSGGGYLLAYHHDGRELSGFPATFLYAPANVYPVMGDVDGDGQREIVVLSTGGVRVFSPAGVLERTIAVTGGLAYGTAPALADLDGDGRPEIILQLDGALNVWTGNGTPFPGWPVTWAADSWAGNSSPVVGDVDGDPSPEIVLTTHPGGQSETGEVRVYNTNGTLHPRFPKGLPIGSGAVPAIADIDRDGRNEIIVCGNYWNGYSGMYDKCWAFDLGGGPHGPILWGQFSGGASHQGRYPVPK